VDLLGHLRANDERISEEVARKIFRQIVIGVRHLHAANVIHRDLKLENVMVYGPASDPKIKIVDFGWSKDVGPGMSLAKSMAGSEQYACPEIKDPSKRHHDFRADLWSMGVLLFVMLTEAFTEAVRAAGTQAVVTQQEIDSQIRAVPDLSEGARSVILGLLRIQPTERTSLEVLLEDPWLAIDAVATPCSSPPSIDEPSGKVRRIMEMGFTRSRVEVALGSTHGDVQAAVDKLIGQSHQYFK